MTMASSYVNLSLDRFFQDLSKNQNRKTVSNFSQHVTDCNFKMHWRHYFKILGIRKRSRQKHLSKVEKEGEFQFDQTTKRRDDGRFVVELPFNKNIENLGLNKAVAMKRFLNVEKSLEQQKAARRKLWLRERIHWFRSFGKSAWKGVRDKKLILLATSLCSKIWQHQHKVEGSFWRECANHHRNTLKWVSHGRS